MQQHRKNSVTLVLGGVRSGKSRYAQQLAERCERVTLIATAPRSNDTEMEAKIARHRVDRPADWTTVEEPLRLEQAIAAAVDSDVIVVDCLTLFAANLLHATADDIPAREAAIERLCDELRAARCPVVLVSNEVGSGVVPAYLSGRQFRDLLGEMNQRVAAVADVVLLMVAGLPLSLKGAQ